MLYETLRFILDIVAGIFAGFLLLRFWMQAQRLRAPSQIGQSIYKLTDWLVLPLRKVISGYKGFDWASLLAAFFVACTLISLETLMVGHIDLSFILIFSVIQLMQWILYGLIALLVLEIIFSFVNPHAPLAPLVYALNQPILSPLRKLIPPLAGFDFSILVALIILQLLSRALINIAPSLLF